MFTGGHAIESSERTSALPIWIADYVLMGYGTGAIMAVPAHDAARLGLRENLFATDSRGHRRR